MEKLKKILIIDDDPVSSYITGRLLKKIDVSDRYVVLKNGKEALNFILDRCTDKTGDKICPELIFLDYHMPVMDGKEFLEELIKQNFSNWNEVKVVVISSSLFEKDKEEFMKLGVNDFYQKPLKEEMVYELIQKYFPQEKDIFSRF